MRQQRGGAMASVFVSHSSRDRAVTERVVERLRAAGFAALFVDFDPEQGIPAGRNWERELYAQLRRTDAVVFLASEASVASSWCFAEVGLARSLGRPVFPLRLQPGVALPLLADVQWMDLTDAEAGLDRLLAGLRSAGLDPADSFAWDPHRSPYPGLVPFAAGGRRGVLRPPAGDPPAGGAADPDPAARAGPVRGGGRPIGQRQVLAAARRAAAPAGPACRSGGWWCRRCGPAGSPPPTWPAAWPGPSPTAASPARPTSWPRRWNEARRGWCELAGELADLAGNGAGRPGVLVVIDQAEELLTRTGAREQQAFLQLLAGALHEDSPVWAVATVRSEFLSTAPDRAGLAEAVDDPLVIEPLSRARLAEVIARPAQRAGLEFAPGLVERMVEDTAGGDALPLLAYTLHELYQRAGPDGQHHRGRLRGRRRRRRRAAAPRRPADRGAGPARPGLPGAAHADAAGHGHRRGAADPPAGALRRVQRGRAGGGRRLRRRRPAGQRPRARPIPAARPWSRWRTRRCCGSGRRCARRSRPTGTCCGCARSWSGWPPTGSTAGATTPICCAAAGWPRSTSGPPSTPGSSARSNESSCEASRGLATRELEATRRSNRRLRALAGGLALLLVAALVAGGLAVNANQSRAAGADPAGAVPAARR